MKETRAGLGKIRACPFSEATRLGLVHHSMNIFWGEHWQWWCFALQKITNYKFRFKYKSKS